MLLASVGRAQDVPSQLSSTNQPQDVGGLWSNNNDLAARNKDRATNVIGPQFCPAGQALTGAYYNKSGATIGGTCTTIVSPGTNNAPQQAWQGINYFFGSSSATVIYSTGATPGVTTGVDSYHISDSSWIVNGSLCHTSDTLFTLPRSTISVAWLGTDCNLHVSGSTTTFWASISSYTSVIGDGIPIAISSTGASGDVHIWTIINDLPVPSMASAWSGRGATTADLTATTGLAPDQWWPCYASHNVFPTCTTGVLTLIPMTVRSGSIFPSGIGAGAQNTGGVFIVNNIGSGAQNITFSNMGASAWEVSIDGGGLISIPASTNSTTVSVGTGRHGVLIQGQRAESSISWAFPSNMKFVRPGPI